MKNFINLHVSEKHRCKAEKHGDWIIYECPECDYQLWDNTLNGELKIFNVKADVKHSGWYEDTELKGG